MKRERIKLRLWNPKSRSAQGLGLCVCGGGVLSSRSQGKGLEKLCEVSGAGKPRDHIGDMPREPM